MRAEWRAILSAAERERSLFADAVADPVRAQTDLLDRILADNAASPFGQAHGFADIATVEQFRARVPMATYDDFAKPIEETAQTGASPLTSASPVAFERTGGSSAGSKLIPYPPAMIGAFRSAILVWLHDLAERIPAVTRGTFYASISPATRQAEVTPSGIPIGMPSDAAYLGADLAASFMGLLAVSPDLGAIRDPAEWQVATLAALIEADDLSFVSIWSPTFLLALLEALPSQTEAVRNALSRSARVRFDRALEHERLDTQQLWPDLACISCWTAGPSAAFARQLQALFPHAAIDPKGVLATEAPITLTCGQDARNVPALTSCFVEFLDRNDIPHLCDELTVAETYRAVITTPGGFYRYDIGDVFECTAMTRGVPRLEFVGRAGLACDLVGEKLEDGFVTGVLAQIAVPALIAPRADRRGYELIADSADRALLDVDKVERGLCENPQYAYARQMGQLESLMPRSVANLSQRIISRGMQSGRMMGDIKTSGLMADPWAKDQGQ